MRALVRGDEVMPEDTWSEWVKSNLAFLTGTEKDEDGNPIPGDGWTLVENYIEVADGAIYDVAVYPEPEETPSAPAEAPKEVEPSQDTPEPEKEAETVTYAGKTYTLDELKKLLG